MARLTRESGDVPSDLRTFVPRRWIKAALDNGDSHLASLARQLTRAEVYQHWYAVIVVAPALYRAALWDAVGQRDGEHHFEGVMGSLNVVNQRRRVMASAVVPPQIRAR
jgi:hypothetical protein